MKKEGYTQVHLDQVAYTRRLTEQKERIAYTRTFTKGKARIPWKTKYLVHGILIHGIGPRYLVRGIDPRYLVLGIGPNRFWSMVFRKA